MIKIKKTASGLLMVIVCAITLSSCNQNQQAQQYPPMELPVNVIQKGNGLVAKEFPASLEGIADVEIRPQVSGYLQKILVDEGAYVNAGQLLFQIDSRIYAEQYNTAKSAVSVASANLTNAKIDLNRRKELVKEKIVSDLQVQQAQATYDAAKAALSQAEAAAQAAKINYDFCSIKAPVSGYLGRINYRLGSLIEPTSVEAITILSDIHQVNAYFSMSEIDFFTFQNQYKGNTIDEKIKNSAHVGLQIADGNLYEEKGKIDAIEGQFNANTGSVSFRAKFNNPKGILRAGNTGKVLIEQNYADVVLVPVASTFNIQDKVYIYTLDKENKAVQNQLEVSGKSGANYMISSGVNPGDTYVVSGYERLQPGMPVVPQPKDNGKQGNKAGSDTSASK